MARKCSPHATRAARYPAVVQTRGRPGLLCPQGTGLRPPDCTPATVDPGRRQKCRGDARTVSSFTQLKRENGKLLNQDYNVSLFQMTNWTQIMHLYCPTFGLDMTRYGLTCSDSRNVDCRRTGRATAKVEVVSRNVLEILKLLPRWDSK